MFDSQLYTSLRHNAEQVAAARGTTALATGTQVCDALREVQTSIDMLDGVRADLLARLESTEGHAEEGASTTASWARRELRMGLGESRKNRRAGDTLHTLSHVAAALAAGRIRAEHVYEFTAGITKLGAAVMQDLEEILLPVAETNDPSVLKDTITELHEVLHPDDLDKKYAAGMERKDLKATKCGDGYHVSGFLDIVAGAKVHAWLKDVSGPEYDGDDRTPAQRRVDAFCRLFDQALTLIQEQEAQPGGHHTTDTDLPSDNDETSATSESDTAAAEQAQTAQPGDTGADAQPTTGPSPRPRRADTRLLVLADLETLLRLPGAAPATLAGYGHIGTQLLGYLACGSDLTGILTDGVTDGPVPQADVLNVGRTHRLATVRQRDAVIARQDGVCAAPGCGLTYLEIHHVAWWDRDTGATDLSNLVGICSRCHHLVHQNKLTIAPDGQGGFTFHRQNGRIIDDHTRVTKQQIRDIIAKIRHAAASDAADGATGKTPTSPEQPANPPGGETEQAQRLRSMGIEVRRIEYDDLVTTYPPPE